MAPWHPTAGVPCSLLRQAQKASARVADCFTGPGLAAAGAAEAHPAALVAAADADGSTVAHAASAADADGSMPAHAASAADAAGSMAAHAAHRGTALDTATTRDIASEAASAPRAHHAREPGIVQAYAQASSVVDSTARNNDAAVCSHAGGSHSPLAAHQELSGQGAGVRAGTLADVEPKLGWQLRPTEEWTQEEGVREYVPHGHMAALVCPWQTPRQAVDLLLELC